MAPHIAAAIVNDLPPRLVRTYGTNTLPAGEAAPLDLWADHLVTLVAGEKSDEGLGNWRRAAAAAAPQL